MLDLYAKTSEELMTEFIELNERINNINVVNSMDKLRYELYLLNIKRIENELIHRRCI